MAIPKQSHRAGSGQTNQFNFASAGAGPCPGVNCTLTYTGTTSVTNNNIFAPASRTVTPPGAHAHQRRRVHRERAGQRRPATTPTGRSIGCSGHRAPASRVTATVQAATATSRFASRVAHRVVRHIARQRAHQQKPVTTGAGSTWASIGRLYPTRQHADQHATNTQTPRVRRPALHEYADQHPGHGHRRDEHPDSYPTDTPTQTPTSTPTIPQHRS